MKKWQQLTVIFGMILAATLLVGWRLTSTTATTAQKSGYAGMQLEVNDLAKLGVLVHSPANEGFYNKLSSLVSIPNELAGDAAKYSLIIENKTPQHISAISVVWRFYSSQGQAIERTYEFSSINSSFFDDVSDSLIKSGEHYPLCLFAQSVGFGREPMSELKSDAQMTETLSAINTLMARSTRWSFTIESVLFSNGVWVGPNSTGYVERMTARINGARDLLKELAQKLDAGEATANVLAHARAYAGPADEPASKRMMDRERINDPNYHYEWAKKNAAREALARQKNFGGDKSMIEWVRQHTSRQIELVRR
jgi:hypothetical protein